MLNGSYIQPQSVIAISKQKKKLQYSINCLLIVALLFVIGFAKEPFLILLATIIGLVTFFYACISIKCPQCKLRWFWYAVSKKNFFSSLEFLWLAELKSCPRCGYPEAPDK